MQSDGSVTNWIQALKAGDRGAAQALWNRYFEKIVRQASKQINRQDRRVADEDDIAISVFTELCSQLENGSLPYLSGRDELWRLLIRMTAHKSVDQIRYLKREKRGAGKVRGESVFESKKFENAPGIEAIIGDEPGPEFVVALRDQIASVFAALPEKNLQEIARGKMEGRTNQELASIFDCSERTIERRLQMIRVKCEEEFLS